MDYEWQFSEASEKLETYVKSFKLYKIGLNDDVSTKVCPEAKIELYECMESTTNENVQDFYQDCLEYINEIFRKGADDLKEILGIIAQAPSFKAKQIFSDDEYFPQYVSEPVDYWLSSCARARNDVEMYSNDFLQTFERSDFFSMCKKKVEGKLQWKDWGACSVSCGGGFQTKIAISCIPDYAVCYGIQILERSCNDQICPDMPSPYLPAGTIISWVPRPNKNAPTSVYFNDDTWIECNGIETCKSGRFEGQSCSDLSDRVLVGAGKLGQILDLKDASLPDHAHNHTHTGLKNYTASYRAGPSWEARSRSGTGGHNAAQKHDHNHYEV